MIVSGKLRAQRAKSMKFKDGYMVSSGNPVREYIDSATRHVMLRQVSSLFWQLLLLAEGQLLMSQTKASRFAPAPFVLSGVAGFTMPVLHCNVLHTIAS